MSVEIKAGRTFELGAPKVLFQMCGGVQSLRGGEAFYDVVLDGSRFLASCLTPEAKQRPITVMIDWQRMAKQAP